VAAESIASRIKVLLSRMANGFIRLLFRDRLVDTTKAFKACRLEEFRVKHGVSLRREGMLPRGVTHKKPDRAFS